MPLQQRPKTFTSPPACCTSSPSRFVGARGGLGLDTEERVCQLREHYLYPSAANNIRPAVARGLPNGGTPVRMCSTAGPGTGIYVPSRQAGNAGAGGRLVVPGWGPRVGQRDSWNAASIYSDDAGATWKIGAPVRGPAILRMPCAQELGVRTAPSCCTYRTNRVGT